MTSQNPRINTLIAPNPGDFAFFLHDTSSLFVDRVSNFAGCIPPAGSIFLVLAVLKLNTKGRNAYVLWRGYAYWTWYDWIYRGFSHDC